VPPGDREQRTGGEHPRTEILAAIDLLRHLDHLVADVADAPDRRDP